MNCFSIGSAYLYIYKCYLVYSSVVASISVRGFLIIKTNNLVNEHLYFVMATVPYLLYITTTLYLNTTYTVSLTKNSWKNNQYRLIQMTITDTLQLMA